MVSNPYPESGQPAAQGPIKILSMGNWTPDELAQLTAAGGANKVEITIATSREDFRAKLRDAEVVWGQLRAEDLDYAPRLKWIMNPAAGMESADPKVMASNITITNNARTFAPGIAETAIGLLLALTRGIGTHYVPAFLRREWKPVGSNKSNHYIELAGRTVAIVGMGGIGSEIGRRLHYGFNMTVLATDAKPMPKPDFVHELREPSWYKEMVKTADVVVSAAPQTPVTTRMFNEEIFRSMKRSAYFIAVSRGPLFDDMALVKALKEGWIAGAGLDVFPMEPPPSSHPIYDLKNVVMTPHTSGWGPERQTRLVAFFAENIRRYSLGLPLMNVVDKAKGY